jgi:hypothetical protein
MGFVANCLVLPMAGEPLGLVRHLGRVGRRWMRWGFYAALAPTKRSIRRQASSHASRCCSKARSKKECGAPS